MRLRKIKWPRLLTFAGLLLVTAGVAATPMKKGMAYLANPLGSWSFTKAEVTTAAPTITSTGELTPRRAEELALAYSAVPHYLDFRLAREGSLFSTRDEWSQGLGSRASSGDGGWSSGSARFWRPASWGRWANAAGGSGGQSGAAGAGGLGRLARNGSGRSARSIFNEHRAGLGGLTAGRGGGSLGSGGSLGAGPTLSSTPEPSTLLLFGTGLATAAGAIRRRLRRR